MFNWYFLLYRRHIISASYMDIFFGVENTPTYPRNIPNVEMFEMNVRGSAVNNRDHVVIYENTGRYGFFLGARTWWMFKVITGIQRHSCHCQHHHHHEAFILITVMQSLLSSSSFTFTCYYWYQVLFTEHCKKKIVSCGSQLQDGNPE